VAGSLCDAQEERMIRELEVYIGNSATTSTVRLYQSVRSSASSGNQSGVGE